MRLARWLLAAMLLVVSGQSLALFMPEGFSINTEVKAVADGDC